MGSIRLPESIGKLSKTSNTTLSFPSSIVNIGGSQYRNINALTLTTGTIGVGGVDAALTISSTYYVYAVVSEGVLAIIGSKNSSLPSGFTLAKQIGLFNTNASNLIGYPDVPVSTSIPGQIICFGGATPPVGWFICDGSIISRTLYLPLFQAIGTAWGYGDNSTTFNLPDLRGRFLRGVTADTGRDPDLATRAVCNTGGNTAGNVGSIQGHTYSSHSHLWPAGQVYKGAGDLYAGHGGGWPNYGNNGGWYTPALYTDGAGGSETRPLNANINYIIKY